MPNMVLAGFMGTGKTTIGRLVAGLTGLAFVDTDDLIVAEAGRSIAAIFAEDGEAAFRALEAAVCLRVAGQSGQVVATGGGALLNPAVLAAFVEGGVVIGLHCELAEIVRRVGHDPARPLFSAEMEKLGSLLAGRAAHYDSLPHHIDTTRMNPEDAAKEAIRLWQQYS